MTMRLIESIEDQMSDVQTYELADGQRVRLAGCAVREVGAAKLLYQMGLAADPKSLPAKPVFWHGEMVGWLPGDFNPRAVRSGSLLYDPRPGDFTETDKGWLAATSLGLGDLEVIDGFRPA